MARKIAELGHVDHELLDEAAASIGVQEMNPRDTGTQRKRPGKEP